MTADHAPWVTLASDLWNVTRPGEARSVAARGLPAAARSVGLPADGPPAAAKRDPRPPMNGERVGIWCREVDAEGRVSFVRERTVARPYMWASAERIGPKARTRTRVVLLGESAARGWPLDPFFTCASCLEAQLRHAIGGDDVEVIDLARAGVDAAGLTQLAVEAAALEPDAYVLFAGNNWGFNPAALDLAELGALVRRMGSWHPIAEVIEAVYRSQLDAVLASLGQALRLQGVPVLFVIPAYCLADWQSTPRSCHPLLGGADRQRATRLGEKARDWLARERFDEARDAATELLGVEEGFSATARDVLGRCALVRRDYADAIRHFEASWDIGLSLLIPPFSGFSTRADHLRRRARTVADAVIDLPRQFVELNDGAPTDRRFFFGHVHMTPHAIRAAMALAAEPLLRLCGRTPVAAGALADLPADPELEAIFQGHFAAALKSGGDDQTDDLLRHHCAQAIRCQPALSSVVGDYVERSVRRAPDIFCAAAHRLRASERRLPVLRHFLNTPPHRRKQRQLRIMHAFIAALAAVDPQRAAQCEALLYREHGLDRNRIDFVEEPGNDRAGAGLEWTRIYRSYLTCYFPCETFHAVYDAPVDELHLDVTARVRSPRAVGRRVRLLVNDTLAGDWPATLEWRAHRIEVSAALLVRGVNTFTVEWPVPEDSAAERIEEIALAFEERSILAVGSVLDMYPVYGEIAECVAAPSCARDCVDRLPRHSAVISHEPSPVAGAIGRR